MYVIARISICRKNNQDRLSLAILLLQCWAIVCGLTAWILPSPRRNSKASEEGKASTCTSSSPWACSQSWGTTAAADEVMWRQPACFNGKHGEASKMAGTENIRKPYPEPQFWRFQFKKEEIFQWWNWWNQILFFGSGHSKKERPHQWGRTEVFPAPQWNLRPPVSERGRTRGQQDPANKSQEGMRFNHVKSQICWGLTW